MNYPSNDYRYVETTEGSERELERTYCNLQLAPILDRWRDQEREHDCLELKLRYQWAKDIMTVYERPSHYGSWAAENLLALRMSTSDELSVYYRVAINIEDDFFAAVMKYNSTPEARARGHLTWSHLKAFANAASVEYQWELFHSCVDEQWSVSTLAERVRDAAVDEADMSRTDLDRLDDMAIAKRITNTASKLAREVEALVKYEQNDLADDAQGELHDGLSRHLGKARTSVVRCLQRLDDAIKQQEECLTREAG